jgi:hypothetical protein
MSITRGRSVGFLLFRGEQRVHPVVAIFEDAFHLFLSLPWTQRRLSAYFLDSCRRSTTIANLRLPVVSQRKLPGEHVHNVIGAARIRLSF